MMRIRGLLLPDEWLSAAEAGRDLLGVIHKTAHGLAKSLISVLVPFAVGASLFWSAGTWIFPVSKFVNDDFLRSVLTVLAILSGFMITTILFTGRPNGLSALNSSELREVRDKISYLVMSQCLTLLSHLVAALYALVAIAATPDGTSVPLVGAALLVGLLLNSLVRSLILPLQIWEVHAFSLDVEISERIKAEQNTIYDD